MRRRRSSFVDGLFTCVALTMGLAGVARAEPDTGQQSPAFVEASAHFAAAQVLYERGAFAEALTRFSASQALVSSPNSRLYQARCLRELGQLTKAHAAYGEAELDASKRAVAEPRYLETQQAALEERAALRKRMAFVIVTMPSEVPTASLSIGADVVAPTAWGHELALAPGRIKVRAEAPGRRVFAIEMELQAGETRSLTVDLPRREPHLAVAPDNGARKLAPFATPLRRWGFVSGAVGVAGLVTWGVFGVAASSRYDDLAKQCLGRCDASRADDIAAGRRETTMSTLGLVTGVVGIAAGATLYAVDLLPLRSWLTTSRASAATLDLKFSPIGVGVGGTF